MQIDVGDSFALLAILFLVQPGTAIANELHCSPSTPVANGNMLVCWKQTTAVVPTHLLIHFHGASQSLRQTLAKSDLNVVLVVVNFPGLSTAYSRPFETDRDLFQQIVDRARETFNGAAAVDPLPRWRHLSVSSFSAGYGAVREILKTPKHFDRIEAIVAADSIYAGLQQTQPDRQVDENNMSNFLRFASLAVDERKTFVISHSAQSTPYASTTETADYLLRSLRMNRNRDRQITIPTMRQLSMASRGKFQVLGFDGESGQDHMQHLHHIGLFWARLSDDVTPVRKSEP